MKKVFIIGGGQLGSRHLQGASQVSFATDLHVVDPSEESLKVAKERFEQTHNGKHTLHLHTSLDDLPNQADLVIISTNSKPRLQIMENLLDRCSVKSWVLEKVLFTQLDEYKRAEQLIQEHQIPTWVNCPRRSYPDYLSLKDRIGTPSSLRMNLEMPGFLIASNGLHFADLFSYFLDDPDTITFDASGLDKQFVEAKRSGYVEVNGELKCSSGNNHLTINNTAAGSVSQSLQITTDQHRITVQESHQPSLVIAGENTQWKVEVSPFEMPFQSALTTYLVESIIQNNTCDLPDYKVAQRVHVAFLEELEKHFQTQLNIT
jgi:predicted dehydrogenase